jgi:uncharacterized protein (TIGR02453 family)
MITRETLRFLGELKKHNRREWFQANKARYEQHVKAASESFLARAAPEVARTSKKLEGGAMRIYRDVRFSKDKSPYRTNLGMHFAAAKDWEGPGYYLHIEPGGSFFAAGMWRPEPALAKNIRDAIAKKPSDWRRVTKGLELDDEDRLARPPRGVPPDHELIDELKRKSFCAVEKLADATVVAGDFPRRFGALCKKTAPLMKFLASAVNVSF